MLIRIALAVLFLTVILRTVPPASAVPPTTTTSQPALEPLRDALAMNYSDPDAHLTLARAYNDRRDLHTAYLICQNARQLFGNDAFMLSFKLTFQNHDLPLAHAAAEVLKTALNLDPHNVTLLRTLAAVYTAHGRPDRAEQYYRQAYKLNRGDAAILKGLCDSLTALGNEAEARSLLSAWCDDHPDTATAVETRLRAQLKEPREDNLHALNEAIQRFPGSAPLYLMRAQLHHEQQHDDQAEADILAAAAAGRDSLEAQSAAAAFFLKVRGDESRSLGFYFNVYFLDPSFNDWQRVDQRIESAEARAARTNHQAPLDDADPFLISAALAKLAQRWDPSVRDKLFDLLDSDAPAVRQTAIDLLANHLGKDSLARIRPMLADNDPWRRAAAAGMVARVEKDVSVRDLSPLLKDPTALVRFAAYTALVQDAGEPGRRAVQSRVPDETDDWLRQAIASFASTTQP